MEGNLSSGNIIPNGASYGGIDLQGSLRVHHQQNHPFTLQHHHQSHPRPQASILQPTIHENYPIAIGTMQECNQNQTICLPDFTRCERGKSSASDDEEPSFIEDAAADGQNDPNTGKRASPWQRVKWTDKMVKLLITAVSYIGEDANSEYNSGARRKYSNLQKKGKWKSISKVMAERGHFVSPQQCEDKFNDLNKRYKRLNEILGRGTSCEVVENPSLLDIMDHVSDKAKEEVRKILSSKHLYYEEMCSYHNGNRLHLPPDPELQHSLRLALRSRDDNENSEMKRNPPDEHDEDDEDAELERRDEYEEAQRALHVNLRGVYGGMAEVSCTQRSKQCEGHGGTSFASTLKSPDFNLSFSSQQKVTQSDANLSQPEDFKATFLQEQWLKRKSLQLEEQKLQIQAQILELERERFKWQRFCRKRDRELEVMKMENERMKLENEHMALELKRKEICGD